jgi:hypothetical protein
MHLAYGWHRTPLHLDRNHNYIPEELEDMLRRHQAPHWLIVEGGPIRLILPSWVTLACRVVCLDHNAYALVDDDGFVVDMARRELAIEAHMRADSSSDDESVTSNEDMVYEREVYM